MALCIATLNRNSHLHATKLYLLKAAHFNGSIGKTQRTMALYLLMHAMSLIRNGRISSTSVIP